jgi:hypothetical protein
MAQQITNFIVLVLMTTFLNSCGAGDDANIFKLTSGVYIGTLDNNDWEKDTCGITAHNVPNIPELELTVMGNQVYFNDLSFEIFEDGTFSFTNDQVVEYDQLCSIKVHSVSDCFLVANDAFDVRMIVDRAQSEDSTDCTSAEEDLDQIPCQEIYTIHVIKKTED